MLCHLHVQDECVSHSPLKTVRCGLRGSGEAQCAIFRIEGLEDLGFSFIDQSKSVLQMLSLEVQFL
jgi:hypothetical protein